MATTTLRTPTAPRPQVRSTAGDLRIMPFEVTFSNSYTTGGETLDFASTMGSGRTLHAVLVPPSGGYVFAYDYTNKKLLAYRDAGAAGAMAQAPAATDLSTLGALRGVAFTS